MDRAEFIKRANELNMRPQHVNEILAEYDEAMAKGEPYLLEVMLEETPVA